MKKFFSILFLCCIAIIPLWSLFHAGLPKTQDGVIHLLRLANFYQNLQLGIVFPRWAANVNWGYGLPEFIFYYPLPYYLASLFHFLQFSYVDSLKIITLLSFIFSGVCMFLWVSELLDIPSGILSGFLYMVAPYKILDLYIRGDIGENLAFVFLPLTLFLLLKTAKTNKHLFTFLAGISLSFLILSHNGISLLFLPFIFLYTIFLIFSSKKRKKLVFQFGVAIVFGFLLSAFFWIPGFFEGKYTLRNIVTKGVYKQGFILLSSLFSFSWNSSLAGMNNTQLGLAQSIALLLFPVLLYFQRRKKETIFFFMVFLYCCIVIFFLTKQSNIFWQHSSLLQNFQFPWRFLAIPVFCLSILAGYCLYLFRKGRWFVLVLIIVLTIFLQKNYWHVGLYYMQQDAFFNKIYAGGINAGETAPIWSVRYMEHLPKAHIELISGKGEIQEIQRTTVLHKYTIDASEKSRVRENTLYFPGWNVLVDGQQVSIEFQDVQNRGLITFFVNQGVHTVLIRFTETKLRLFADCLSFVSWSFILLFFIALFLKKLVHHII
ncbi:MAG: 6-pyruvoyl-tetrahydropterin synthase-related protein [Candidatus Levyibacteriota bacterium]